MLNACSANLIGLNFAKSTQTKTAHTASLNTLAGISDAGGVSLDGSGQTSRFYKPAGITTDGTFLYVADQGNHTIRKVDPITGEVSTLSGTAGVLGLTDGNSSTATFGSPTGLTYFGGYLYVTDIYFQTVRSVSVADGSVVTLAGLYSNFWESDGTGSSAAFFQPVSIASDGTNLYTVDSGANTVRKVVISTGAVTTIAGTPGFPPAFGHADGVGTATTFAEPMGIAIDPAHVYLYITDSLNCTIRRLEISSLTVSTVAGTAGNCGTADGVGVAAQFVNPLSLTVNAAGTAILIHDSNVIRSFNIATAQVTTVAGSPTSTDYHDSTDGTGMTANFISSLGITTFGGNFFETETSVGGPVVKVDSSTFGATTLSGLALQGTQNSTDGLGDTAHFLNPVAVAADANFAYIADLGNHFVIRKVSLQNGDTTTLAGNYLQSNVGYGDSTDGTGATARFGSVSGTVYTGLFLAGSTLYFVDSALNTIRKIDTATGNTITIAGQYTGAGFSDSTDGTGGTAKFFSPQGISGDGTFLYVADNGNMRIRKVSMATGLTSTIAGNGTSGPIDGTGTSAELYAPSVITVSGNTAYFGDGSSIRTLDLTTSVVTTIAGVANTVGSTDGVGTAARFPANIDGLSVSGTLLYISSANIIRVMDLTTLAVSTYMGPGGTINIPASQMPSLRSIFVTPSGFLFTNRYSGVFSYQ